MMDSYGRLGAARSDIHETAPVLTNILIQFEMIELIEGFLLVFPGHVCSAFLCGRQHPIVVSISRSPAG
jgi:hypothetical protein